uniref:Lovastatin nonaketide synthase n=1 Tax=Talaromyces marneffei PM1 TaxID=1077442 RepID=A0A093ULT3_TALMA
MTIDTACSSSLIAVHQAVQALRLKQSNLAVAAGANLIFGPTNYVAESNVNMLSPTGRSRMWSKNADGYARGEGVAAVILKRLSDAIADGDTIDCIIRETGANQDGRTPGITMPSSTSQAQLIQETYTRAGLDIEKDRCQYFEAHGTGTKAGDPQEAGAIYKAFFGDKPNDPTDDNLYVGSIKTVIGHTEGTAGIAGLLRASLGMKHGYVPPNLLFDELNPDIEPYYGRLQIVKTATPWPEPPAGSPRRASINSFGFGGANAHAIIENYAPKTPSATASAEERSSCAAIPFMFSANSEKSLTNQLQSLLSYLEDFDEKSTNLRDVAWTLSRRSAFSLRASYSALTPETLRTKLTAAINARKKDGKNIGVRPSHKTNTILGIFTGQGAQWPQMGHNLIESSPLATKLIDSLNTSLQSLPEQDRPQWSLRAELCKAADSSHVMEGAFSQPLCTAVQVLIVDLLQDAGITFDVVVGHSSGEIGAAYAAGFLSAEDAVRIAYYRGLYGKVASGPNDTAGSMLAVGTSMDDAKELCELATMKQYGKFNVAASNSSASVTLSGDVTAIERAKFIFEDEQKFVRQLKVDTAYHSHHMQPCAEPYMDAMARIKIKVKEPRKSCQWYSSVLGGDLVTTEMAQQLAGSYWRDNLLQPVLFSQALESALEKTITPPALAIEVGPHPALKGPASLIMEEKLGSAVPYTGVLARNVNDVEAISDAVGAVWANVGSVNLNFGNFDKAFANPDSFDRPKFLRTVPQYAWDHTQSFWAESRLSKAMRMRQNRPHELLGIKLDSGEHELRWRNFLKPNEIPWVRGHSIQGQTIFPGAGFAVMAMEATKAFVADTGEEMELIELENLTIHRALGFIDENIGSEVMVTLSNIERKFGLVLCNFTCEACPTKDASPTIFSTARVRLRLGPGSRDTLPPREPAPEGHKITEVDTEVFYSSLAKLGYNYADMFKSITNLSRWGLAASGQINSVGETGYETDLIVHPAPLDVAFQGLFCAIGAPGDGQLWTLMVPTVIRNIKVNPVTCNQTSCLGTDLMFDAKVQLGESRQQVSGDIDVYDTEGNAVLQIEGLEVTSVVQITAKDDAQKFSETIWAPEKPDAAKEYTEFWDSETEKYEKSYFVERVCFLYMKRLHNAIPMNEREGLEWHPRRYLNWVASVVRAAEAGTHPTIKKEWLNDTVETLKEPMQRFAEQYEDFHYLSLLGDNLIPFIRGEVSLLEVFRGSDILDHVYKHTYSVPEYNSYLGGLVGQLTHKHRQLEILEIGAGTGSATEAIMGRVGDNFGSYTYTDISASFFPDAQELFKEHDAKFMYKTLDIEGEPTDQGFTERRYDLIVASNVLHATKFLEKTLKNVRKLLRPGGYLVLLEITDNDPVRQSFFFGSLPGWWVGEEDGRVYSPLLSQHGWDAALRKSGFSGIESTTPESGMFMVPLSVILSQAVDSQIELIRQPLDPEHSNLDSVKLPKLLVLADQGATVAPVQAEVLSALAPFSSEVEVITRIEDLQESNFGPRQLVLSLMELDTNIFDPFTPERWRAIQLLTEKSSNILWVTRGGAGENPFSNMMVGVSRCLVPEKPDLRFQVIDFAVNEPVDATYIASSLMRLHISGIWNGWLEPYVTTWLLEREIRVVNGQVIIPRMIPCKAMDSRFNSSRRTIRKELSTKGSVITVDNVVGTYELREVTMPTWVVPSGEELVEVKTLLSTLAPLKINSIGSLYLIIGKMVGKDQTVIAFSETLQSRMSVSQGMVLPVDVSEDQGLELLTSVMNYLLGHYLASQTAEDTYLMVHEPTASLKASLNELARDFHVGISLTTSDSSRSDLKYIHARAHRRTVASLLPAKLSAFAYFSIADESIQSGPHIEAHLPSHVKRVSPSEFFARTNSAHVKPHATPTTALKLLQAASDFFKLHPELDASEGVRELSLDEVPGHTQDPSQFTLEVVNLSTESSACVSLCPAEDMVQFRADETYWLAGLTGDLGISLTRWMVERGARYVVLTSRSPKVDQKWLEGMTALGATVTVLPMDITDEKQVSETYHIIKETLPPVAGVCNGAMVLNDGLIANQSFEDFNGTLEPKVKGTRYLNALFQKPDLDFFIIFSSLAYTTGNIGQASYAAANGFMVSMAEGRRRRGLAGSVMNMAGIHGIGYITRREANLMDRLEKLGYSNISEWDFLQFFAEAVLSGRPDGGAISKVWEISSAIRPVDADAENQPPWLQAPRFSWYKRARAAAAERDDGATFSVREHLKEQTTMQGVTTVLMKGFVAILYKLLGMSPEDGAISPGTSLIELGIDSLVAVDMRFWFTRELDLDLPVLKLLGGATIEDMVEDAVARLSPTLIPNVKDLPKPATEAAAEPASEEAAAATPNPEIEIEDASSTQGSSDDEKSQEGSFTAVSASISTNTTPPQSVKG